MARKRDHKFRPAHCLLIGSWKSLKRAGGRLPLTGIFFFCAALLWGFVGVTFAEEASSPQLSLQSSQTNDKSIVNNQLFLTLGQTLRLAIEGNKEIQVSAFSPAIAEEELNAILAIYSPSLFEENSTLQVKRPIQSILDNGSAEDATLIEHKWNLRAGIKKPLATGGTFSFYTDVDHLNSSSELIIPNPQYAARLTIELRQALLREFGDKSNRAAIDIANRKLAISNAQCRKILARVLNEVGSAYWKLVYYQKQFALRRTGLTDAENVYQNEIVRNEKGFSTLLNVDRAFSEVQERKRDLIISNRQLLLAMDQLKLLIGLDPASPYFVIDIQPTEKLAQSFAGSSRNDLLAEALQNRPELIIANKKINIATIKKNLAEHLKLPKLDVVASYSLNGLDTHLGNAFDDTYNNRDASWEVGLGFEWPLGGQKGEANYNKALRERQQARVELDRMIAQITYDVNAALTEIEQAALEVEVTKNACDARKRVLERERARFELAKISNRDLLKAQNDFHDAERTYLKTRIDFNIALLQLKWGKGTIMEDFGINKL